MGTLFLSVIVLLVVAAVAEADIYVDCLKDSVNITWRIQPELVPSAHRLFLGNCMGSKLTRLPTGEGEVYFHHKLGDCKFRRLVKGKHLIYQNDLTFRPQAKPKPAAFTFPIRCLYKRPEEWVPPFLVPGTGVTEGRGSLLFHMALLDQALSGFAETNVVPLGSLIPIWAAVEQRSHQPLLLLMEDCVAAPTPELQPGSQVHPIVGNQGCLFASKWGNSSFLRSYHSSELILHLQAFKFASSDKVYLHCKLTAWDPENLNEHKKACHYANGGWELVDDPSRSSLCDCCDSSCVSRPKRAAHQRPGSNVSIGTFDHRRFWHKGPDLFEQCPQCGVRRRLY